MVTAEMKELRDKQIKLMQDRQELGKTEEVKEYIRLTAEIREIKIEINRLAEEPPKEGE